MMMESLIKENQAAIASLRSAISLIEGGDLGEYDEGYDLKQMLQTTILCLENAIAEAEKQLYNYG